MQNIKNTVMEVVLAVLPITFVVIILQFSLLWMPAEIFFQFLAGVVMVSVGLILFLLGVHVGLLPVGEMIGAALPKTKKISLIIFFGFLLGFVVTLQSLMLGYWPYKWIWFPAERSLEAFLFILLQPE